MTDKTKIMIAGAVVGVGGIVLLLVERGSSGGTGGSAVAPVTPLGITVPSYPASVFSLPPLTVSSNTTYNTTPPQPVQAAPPASGCGCDGGGKTDLIPYVDAKYYANVLALTQRASKSAY